MSDWKTRLTNNGVNVVSFEDFDKYDVLEKIQDESYYTMNESNISSECDFRGVVVEHTATNKGSIQHIKFKGLPQTREPNCIFVGTIDDVNDPFVQKILNDEDAKYLDSLKCDNILYYHGALEKLTGETVEEEKTLFDALLTNETEEKTSGSINAQIFINPGGCFESVHNIKNVAQRS